MLKPPSRDVIPASFQGPRIFGRGRSGSKPRPGALTLIELLVVIGIMIVLMGLLIPAFNSIKGAGDITKAAYDLAGTFEQARAYAMGSNTYVWIGFFEEDGSKDSTIPATAGTGRVVFSVVASKDGTRYRDVSPDATNPPPFPTPGVTLPTPAPNNPVQLLQINKLVKLNGIHIGSLNDGLLTNSANNPKRPPVPTAYQVGHADFGMHQLGFPSTMGPNPTTFAYPLAGTVQYTFTKSVEFNPMGEATKISDLLNGPPAWLEIGVQPVHGSAVDTGKFPGIKAAAAIMVDGVTGRVEMFRP